MTPLALLLAAGAAAQCLTGGEFEMHKHGMGSAASAEYEVLGTSLAFTGGARQTTGAAYPLSDLGGWQLYPTPGGLLPYLTALNNQIEESGASITLLSGALPENFELFVNDDPLASPMRADPAAINTANLRLAQTVGPRAGVAGILELNVLGETGAFYDAALARPATLSISYADADNDGMVDGVVPAVRTKGLAIYALDEAHAMWVRMPSSIDAASRKVTATTPHFSVYALIGTADTQVDAVYAFPVPWAPNSGNPSDGTLAGGITFTNLPSEGTIKIYNVAGQQVRALSIPANVVPPQLVWNGKTDSGQDAVSGVYLWRVESGRNSKRGKLIIIR